MFIAHNHERRTTARLFMCAHFQYAPFVCRVFCLADRANFHTRDSQFVTRVTRTRALRLSRLSCLAQMLSICTQCIFTIGMCVVRPTAAKTNARRWLFLRTAPTRMRSRAFFIHLAMDVTGVCDCVNCSYGRGIVAMFCLRPKYTQHLARIPTTAVIQTPELAGDVCGTYKLHAYFTAHPASPLRTSVGLCVSFVSFVFVLR